MTEIQSFLHGRFPRSEELVQATRDLDRDRTTAEQVDGVRDKDRERLLEVQDKAGLAPVTDGMLSWQDAFRPFTEAVQGLELGPLVRYFDTNTFYKRVHVKARMFYTELPDHALPACGGRPGVATLPGPHWCTRDFEDEVWGNPINRIEAITHEVHAKIAQELADAGAELLVLEEPRLARDDDDVDLARQAWDTIADVHPRTVIHHPMFDASGVLDALPDDLAVGVDLFATDPQALQGRSFPGGLVLGVVDSRAYRLEPVEEIAEQVLAVLDAVETPWLGLTTSTHLEFLPAERAREKALRLGEAADRIQEGI